MLCSGGLRGGQWRGEAAAHLHAESGRRAGAGGAPGGLAGCRGLHRAGACLQRHEALMHAQAKFLLLLDDRTR
jgi:hypothetical protein